ncbi:hypothetical protein [Streptomyces profundus]|uniref:hypothetical protein n=1 Tax=Streptomyces profundus TaxID=2867410 RepID=UPI001D165C61|nr:hypothetical protein [Streptomyces sp. MA3_2.13]UED83394.1 hypothetical protein K4G22_03550 [Streptomyces sp. MA3_2.13]
MSNEGLYYLPEGFREGARANTDTADAADGVSRYLGRVPIDPAGYAGADAFPKALTSTRDVQSRSVARAAEGRTNMAAADRSVATTGETMDTEATRALTQATTPTDRTIADGV